MGGGFLFLLHQNTMIAVIVSFSIRSMDVEDKSYLASSCLINILGRVGFGSIFQKPLNYSLLLSMFLSVSIAIVAFFLFERFQIRCSIIRNRKIFCRKKKENKQTNKYFIHTMRRAGK